MEETKALANSSLRLDQALGASSKGCQNGHLPTDGQTDRPRDMDRTTGQEEEGRGRGKEALCAAALCHQL